MVWAASLADALGFVEKGQREEDAHADVLLSGRSRNRSAAVPHTGGSACVESERNEMEVDVGLFIPS